MTAIFIFLWYFRDNVLLEFLRTGNIFAMSLLIMVFILFLFEKAERHKKDVYFNLAYLSI
ncbi:hypothetical protein ACFLQI_01160 [Candidatus Undinarchaeota archaeon]